MSQYPPVRPWAILSTINREGERSILYEEERQQWLRQHPHVIPQTAKRSRNRSQRAFADRGPSMAEGLRDIAERGAARRNGTPVTKNDVSTKPLPPIPQQEEPQPATTVGQEGVLQCSGPIINKMSIYYVLDRSNMQGHHEPSFAQQEDSQSATEVGQKAAVDGSVHSSEKMNLNLLLEECKVQGYDDETPSIQPKVSEPALPPFLHHHYNAQASHTSHSSDFHRLDHAAPCAAPAFDAPYAQANSRPHHDGYSLTSWYEAPPTRHESSPDAQIAVVPSNTPVPDIKQENQVTEVGATLEELIALINQAKENYRLASENRNPGSSDSAYRFAPPNSASVDIYHADQPSGPGFQARDSFIQDSKTPLFAGPGTIREVTPRTPVWSPTLGPCPNPRISYSAYSLAHPNSSPLFVNSGATREATPTTPGPSPFYAPYPCAKGCCYWTDSESESASDSESESEFEPETTLSVEPQFHQECSASNVPLQEPPVLHLSAPQAASLQGDITWRQDTFDGIDTGIVVPLEQMYARDYTTPDSPLLDSPISPAPAPPSPERRPNGLPRLSYTGTPRVGIYPSNIPLDPRLTRVHFRPDYVSSPVSYPRWLSEERTNMDNDEHSLVPQKLDVTKNPTFTMDVPIHDVSRHQTAIHVSESTNGEHSRAASFINSESNVNNTSGNATLSRITESPDAYSSEGSEGSRGKRKRFTKNLFGKNGYLEDNEEPRSKRFRFLKGAVKKGHSTIKGMLWDGNRALINSSKPSIVTENTATITLNTDVQSILYAEIENMITQAANEFLMKEYYEGHLTTSSLSKLKRRWERKNMPGVPQFRFDQFTQYKLISANRNHLKFGDTNNNLGPTTVLSNWKKICKHMNIRTFVAPDSVVKKDIHDILDLLRLLKADKCHIELIMALDAHVRGELEKREVMQHYRDTQNSGNSRF
ncbi:hypothetical protein PCG10_009086 [Penicillium crustosum]|uniref:Uncharacterized protein n=1 Tax=Penicillium crustosum TaxID=36656 RepID=A0A9P5KY36_PENCR|nr:uncharacterized protein N7487_005804 [Penicillium crustosum]KAF7520596.1 hypothetical protein PCG10_009086 [Penicillium crustosum]KAJ5411445.1 hypothetical protein N7487_005804 [Penicillium crustosum]